MHDLDALHLPVLAAQAHVVRVLGAVDGDLQQLPPEHVLRHCGLLDEVVPVEPKPVDDATVGQSDLP